LRLLAAAIKKILLLSAYSLFHRITSSTSAVLEHFVISPRILEQSTVVTLSLCLINTEPFVRTFVASVPMISSPE